MGSVQIVQESGVHTSDIKVTRYGLPKAFRTIIDPMIKQRMTPLHIVEELKQVLNGPEYANTSYQAIFTHLNADKAKLQRVIGSRKYDLKQKVLNGHESIVCRKDLDNFTDKRLVR